MLTDARSLANQAEAVARVQEAFLEGLKVPAGGSVTRFRYVPGLSITANPKLLEAIERKTEVGAMVFPDHVVKTSLGESVKIVGAEKVWGENLTGQGQVVAVLDNGFQVNHAFLGSSKVVSEACYSTNDRRAGAESLCPGGATDSIASGSAGLADSAFGDSWHGTHVAAIIAASDSGGCCSGVAKEARLVLMQVFSKRTKGVGGVSKPPYLAAYSGDIVRGLERVLELKVLGKVPIAAVNISASVACEGIEPRCYYESSVECDRDHAPIKRIVDVLWNDHQIPTIVAAGNQGKPDSVGAPSCISTVIPVGGTNKLDKKYTSGNLGELVRLVAPADQIKSAVPYRIGSNAPRSAPKSGTSMAAPHVAAAWAILRQECSSAGAGVLRKALENTGPLLKFNGREVRRLDIEKALVEVRANCARIPLTAETGDR